jgi:hypothetical protein
VRGGVADAVDTGYAGDKVQQFGEIDMGGEVDMGGEADAGTDAGDEVDMAAPMEIDPIVVCRADCNDQNPEYNQRLDCDFDGLSNAEEQQLGSDSCENDTDGDGLNDLTELQEGADPLSADSDGDGLQDGDEIRFGFDPTNPSTLNDMVLDGDRWIVSACAPPINSEPVDYYASAAGDWRIGLPPAFNSYSELTIAGIMPGSKTAASVFDDPANEVAASLLSVDPTAQQTSPVDVLLDSRSDISAVGAIVQDTTGGEFQTHDRNTAAIGRYLIRSSSARTARAIRDSLLTRIAPFGAADIQSGLPVASGSSYNLFRVFLSVTYRANPVEGDRLLIAVAVAPADKFDTRDKVKFRMDDLTNTTNFAQAADSEEVRCTTFRAGEGNPEADFYWVLDQSGSMYDNYNDVRAVANQFYFNLNNTALDYRLAVTTMDQSYGGRPRGNVGWHDDLATFLAEIDDVENGPYNGGAEFGLVSGKAGIEWMRSSQAPQNLRIRSSAQLITIFMSDEEDNTFQGDNLSSSSVAALLNTYETFFAAQTIAFAIVGIDPGNRYSDGEAYREVALATGGSFADLEAADISETIDEIIYAATGLASNYQLPTTPISSTLRVFKNGVFVPRSRNNGFDYFAQSNAIAFFGTFRPEPADPTMGRYGDDISVSYQAFVDTTKTPTPYVAPRRS